MRTCPTCGRGNPPDRDFCECGEYLRWERTGVIRVVTPDPGAGTAAAPKTAVQLAVPATPAPPDTVRITLRHPDRDADNEHTLGLSVEPGQRDRVLALVRNQGTIVDNYRLRLEGMPDSWWSIYPDTVYLVPFGTGGTYEQEVEIHIHPPRSPEAKAHLWDLKVVAHSKAQERTAAAAPMGLVIEPYTETSTSIRPQRAKGRRKAHYDVAIENKANAPVLVALEGEDPDDELDFGFNRPPHEIPPGQTVASGMQVRPPKQIWIGRPVEKRFTVKTLTGEEAEERLAAEPTSAAELERGRPDDPDPGVYGPRVYKPQVHKPGMQVGPSGITFQKPQFTGPQVQGPQVKGMNLDAGKLMPGKGGTRVHSGPLLPSQGVFRQKAWLPWWLVPVAIALAALAVLLYMLLPNNVVVPDLVGAKSTFDAEKELTEAGLELAATPKEKVDPDAPAGSVIGQTPAAGEKAGEGEQVTVQIAVGTDEVKVPGLVGMTLSDADALLRKQKLTLGQTAPTPPDPEGEIASQIPAEDQIVKAGTPVNVFFEHLDGGKGAGESPRDEDESEIKAADAPIIVPEISGGSPAELGKRLADLGLVPRVEPVFDRAPAGTVLETKPPEGAKAEPNDTVTLVVSAGPALLAYDDDQDVLVVDGITGRRPRVVGRTPTIDKDPTFSADGDRIAYQAAGQVFQVQVDAPDDPPLPLTDGTDQYRDLAFAPTTERDVLAMLRVQPSSGVRQLCVGRVVQSRLTPTCADPPPGILLAGVVRWAPDGRTLLISGSSVRDLGEFGMVQYRSPRAFSADAGDWKTSGYVTRVDQPGRGVIDAAYSPDGEQLAIVSNVATKAEFRISLTTPAGIGRDPGRLLPVTACKVIWRPDGLDLVVMQADDCMHTPAGRILGIPLSDPQDQRSLQLVGDNMAFAPLRLSP